MLGVLSDEDFLAEVNKHRNEKSVTGVVIDKKTPGRTEGATETPESVKKVIAELSIEGVSNKDLARQFNVSEAAAQAYSTGAVSTGENYYKPDVKVKSHIERVRNRIQKRASHTLTEAISHITEDKLKETKARDLAGIAKDMSQVIRNMEPEKSTEKGNNAQFIFFAPPKREAVDYEVITVNE
jgi:hypothetical protein